MKDAAASTEQVARLAPLDPYYAPFSPLGLPGAVSSTNVNVPGKFSYVVNAVHPTQPEVSLQLNKIKVFFSAQSSHNHLCSLDRGGSPGPPVRSGP